jgi:MFS family permease
MDFKLMLLRSNRQRYYITFLVCISLFLSTFLASGPSVDILAMAETFFGKPGPDLLSHISKVAYFITGSAFAQGIGNLFWMPIILKYGRRPVYICCFTLYTVTAIWASVATSYGSELGSRIVMGFSSGVAECLSPLVIADIYFLHERGSIMAQVYSSASH